MIVASGRHRGIGLRLPVNLGGQRDEAGRPAAGRRGGGLGVGGGGAATDIAGNSGCGPPTPGPVPGAVGANTPQAPHLALTLFARGLLIHLQTRAYFDGDPLNEADPLLSSLDPTLRATMVARHVGEREGLPVWRLDIRLQGEGETVFLDV